MFPSEATSRRSGAESRPGKLAARSRVSRVIGALFLAVFLVTCSGSGDSTPTGPKNDTVTQAVGPAGGTVVTPSGAAGVQIPAGTFSQQVMVTITRLPTPSSPGAGPLPSSLKQYGPYYDFTTSPQVAQFGDSARVGVCQVTDPSSAFYPPEPHDRLRLAHTVGSSIEILDRVGVNDFLRCTNVSGSRSPGTDRNGLRGVLLAIRDNAIGLLRPASLYAAHGGLGGKVKSFSPFGAVDQAVATVTVTLASPTVGVGNSIQASAVLKDADGNVLTGRLVTWTSSNASVATVSSSGLVTGVVAGGPVTITATSEGQNGTAALTVVSATSVVIDGVMSAGEWNGAATFNFTANLPGGGTTPATLFVKNDNQNLYLAVKFARTTVDAGDNRLGFEFDNNNDGLGPANGDDYFGFQLSPFIVFFDAFRSGGGSSVTDDTQRDGAGAFGNNGTNSVYEMSHPLNSGQTGQDFALTAGSTIGLFLQLIIGGVNTSYPGPFIQYTPITIT
jgi:Bacterial Ig-like domain (group 2)